MVHGTKYKQNESSTAGTNRIGNEGLDCRLTGTQIVRLD